MKDAQDVGSGAYVLVRTKVRKHIHMRTGGGGGPTNWPFARKIRLLVQDQLLKVRFTPLNRNKTIDSVSYVDKNPISFIMASCRHICLANADCYLGKQTNAWTISLLRWDL